MSAMVGKRKEGRTKKENVDLKPCSVCPQKSLPPWSGKKEVRGGENSQEAFGLRAGSTDGPQGHWGEKGERKMISKARPWRGEKTPRKKVKRETPVDRQTLNDVRERKNAPTKKRVAGLEQTSTGQQTGSRPHTHGNCCD